MTVKRTFFRYPVGWSGQMMLVHDEKGTRWIHEDGRMSPAFETDEHGHRIIDADENQPELPAPENPEALVRKERP